MILDDNCFKYLFAIYGGTDIRRLSIELMNQDDDLNESTKDSIQTPQSQKEDDTDDKDPNS